MTPREERTLTAVTQEKHLLFLCFDLLCRFFWILFLVSPLCCQFSRSVMSDSLRPHESQHARPPCLSPTPGVHSDSCPLRIYRTSQKIRIIIVFLVSLLSDSFPSLGVTVHLTSLGCPPTLCSSLDLLWGQLRF